MQRRHLSLLTTLFASLALLAMPAWGGERLPGIAVEESDVIEMSDVVILMKNKAFDVIKGGEPARPSISGPFFSMEAGEDTMITLRNKDTVAHEFVSPLFTKTEVGFSGEAVTVFTKGAAGFRINPGKTVTIRFTAPSLDDTESTKDLFWCNVHGKDPGDQMRGELVLMETKGFD